MQYCVSRCFNYPMMVIPETRLRTTFDIYDFIVGKTSVVVDHVIPLI